MKYLMEMLKIIPDIANSKIVWAIFMTHFGIKFVTMLLYIHDWITKGGLRSDLLLLIDKL